MLVKFYLNSQSLELPSKLSPLQEQLSSTFERIGKLIKDASSEPVFEKRLDFVKASILPELELALSSIVSTDIIPVPTVKSSTENIDVTKFKNWSLLHEKLRAKKTAEIISDDRKREEHAAKTRALEARSSIISQCRPPPPPLDLPEIDISPIKGPERRTRDSSAPLLGALPSVISTEKSMSESIISDIGISKVAVPTNKPQSPPYAPSPSLAVKEPSSREESALSPSKPALPAPKQPTESIPAVLPKLSFSFGAPSAQPAKSSPLFTFPPSTAPTPKDTSPKAAEPQIYGSSAPEPSTELSANPAQHKPTIGSESGLEGTKEHSEYVLVQDQPTFGTEPSRNLPEPHQPKETMAISSPPPEQPAAPFQSGMGELSLGSVETIDSNNQQGKSIFGFSPVHTASPHSQAPAQNNTAAGSLFRPSVLSQALPAAPNSSMFEGTSDHSLFGTPMSTPSKPPSSSFALQTPATSFGIVGASVSAPSFGQTSHFGFRPPVPAVSSTFSGSGQGMQAFASAKNDTVGFATYARQQQSGDSSVFGAASQQPPGTDQSKKKLPPSFTQFRS